MKKLARNLIHSIWARNRYFGRAIVIYLIVYLIVSVFDTGFQVWDTPRSQITRVRLNGSDAELYIQTPQELTFDGRRRQGRIVLTVKPRENFQSVLTVLPTATACLTPAYQPISPLSTQPITSTGNDRFTDSCPDEMGATPILTAAPTSAAVNPGQTETEKPSNNWAKQEWSFLVSSSEGALLITSDGVSFTPIITLSVSSNITAASFLVEHAVLTNTRPYANISLEDLDNRQPYPDVPKIRLESLSYFYARKFFEIVLSLGSLFPLLGGFVGYLYQARKERESHLQQIIETISSTPSAKILSQIQPWVQLAGSLTEPPNELRTQIKTVREASQRVARSDVTALTGDGAVWAEDIHTIARRFAAILDSEDIQILDDLRFVVNALRASGTPPPEDTHHSFSDAHLLGVYLNIAWAGMEDDIKQKMFSNLEKLAGQEPAARTAVLQQALWGIYTCDEQIAGLKDRPSLRKELGEWYRNLDVSEDRRSGPRIPSPGDQLFRQLIEQIAKGTVRDGAPGLWEWCNDLQRGLEAQRDRKESFEKPRPRVRQSLWPISGKSAGADANYDYPEKIPPGEFDHWSDAYAELDQPYHHYVQGAQSSGKSRLRIYFEKTFEDREWPGDATKLLVFYFPPVELLYRIENRAFLYRSFANSVANCLVAALLQSYAFEEMEIQRIAPFLAQYGYRVPLGVDSLAFPTSPVADLDEFYANTAQSYRLAQIRSALRKAQERDTDSDKPNAEQILNDMSVAIRETGFQTVYLLVDNLTRKQEEWLWPVLHSPEIGTDLQRRGIYLKTFGVSPGPAEGWTPVGIVDNPATEAQLTIFRQHLLQPF